MGLGYLVERTAQKSNYTGSTFSAFTSNGLAADVVIGQTAIIKVAQNGPVPDSVTLSNGDEAELLHANPNGYCSIWGVVITTGGSGVTATANWGSPQNYPSIQLQIRQQMPAVLNVIDVGDATIASGTNAEISGLTNVGSGVFDFVVLICGQTDANETSVEIHEQFALHEYRRLGGDEFAHMYDHVGNSELLELTLEADYPNGSGPKRLCVVIIEAGSTAAIPAVLQAGRGALWISSGQLERGADPAKYVLNLATGGILEEQILDVRGGGAWFPYDAYIDRTHALVVENEGTGAIFKLKHEGAAGLSLNATIPLPAGELGWFPTVDGDLDFVPAGSFIGGSFFSKDGDICRVAAVVYRVTPLDGLSTITKLMAIGAIAFTANASFAFIGQLVAFTSNESRADYRLGEPCTAKHVCVFVISNERTTPTTIIVVKNDVDTDVTIVVGVGEEDDYFTSLDPLDCDENDRLRGRIVFGDAGTEEFGVRSVQIDLLSTNRKMFGGLGQQGRSPGEGTTQFALCGLNGALSGGYATDSQIVAPLTITKLDIKVIDADEGGALEAYVDGDASGFAVEIPPAATEDWYSILGSLPLSIADLIFNLVYLLLTANDASFSHSMITWAATLLDLTPVVLEPELGPLLWVHQPRRLPADGSIVTDTYSDIAMWCPQDYENGHKEARIAEVSGAERVLSDPVTGEWRGSTCTIRYLDHDRRFRERMVSPVDRYLTEPNQLQLTNRDHRAIKGPPLTAFVGPIVTARPVEPFQFETTLGDLISERLFSDEDLIPWRVLGDSFVFDGVTMSVVAENLDPKTPEPIVLGRHIRVPDIDGASPQGFVFEPIYLGIRTIYGVDYHAWLIAGHACADLPNARVDLTEITEGDEWLIPHQANHTAQFGVPYEDLRSPTYGNLRRYTIMYGVVTDLEADDETITDPDACALGKKRLTVAVEGVEWSGAGTDEVIVDRFQLRKLFTNNFIARSEQDGYQSGPWQSSPTRLVFGSTVPIVDEDSLDICTAIGLERFPVDGYIGAAIIGAKAGDRKTKKVIEAAWNRSCGSRSGPTNLGSWRVTVLHPTAAIKAAAPLYTEATEIEDGSLETDMLWDRRASRQPFVCDWNHSAGQWATSDTIQDASAITNYGGKGKPAAELQLDYAPGITQGSHITILAQRLLVHPPRPVTLAQRIGPKNDPNHLGYVNVGDYIKYRHPASVGTSRAQERLMQVDRVRIEATRRLVIVQGLDCEDHIDYDAPAVAPDPGDNTTCAEAIVINPTPDTSQDWHIDTSAAPLDGSVAALLPEGYAGNRPAWFEVTPAVDGANLFLTTVHSDYDTILAVFTGECGDLTLVQFNDNDGILKTSVLEFPVTNGVTYRILAAAFGVDGGSLTFGAQVYVP